MGFFDDRPGGYPPGPRDGRPGGPPQSPIPLKWVGLAAAVIVFLIVAGVLRGLYVDWLWFDSVGYSSVFGTIVSTRVVLFLLGAAIAVAVIGANVWLARRLAPQGFEESFIEEVDPQAIRRIGTVGLIALTLFMGVIFGSVAGGAWETIMLWQNGVTVGVEEPGFNRDVGFYLFTLPAYQLFQGWVLGLLIVSALGAGAVYGLAISLQRFEISITRGMHIHLSVLGGLVLLTLALGTYLSIFELVNSAGGIVYGGTYTDMNARLPVRYILIVLGAFAGLATIANGFISRSYRLPVFAIGTWAVAGILGAGIYPQVVQRYQVDPNELTRERQYISRNIEMTRYAYALDRVDQRSFPAEAAVTQQELDDHPETVENIRILDPRPLIETYQQLQSIRPLYRFNDIDVDRYELDGSQRQVVVAARELDIGGAGEVNWTRERLQLTHGFGAVVSPVNEIGAEGLPVLWTRGIPPQSEVLGVSIDGSRIYFGELTNHYVIVNTAVQEFDYPLGDTNVNTNYQYDRGIRVGSFLRRGALAWELGDINLLISSEITADSRLLMDRSIRQRIPKVAPFLRLDGDPYVVINDGRIYWMQDAYTVSSHFPYSQPVGGLNYIRNSVKIVLNAQTGDMTFYLVDPNDPVAASWAGIFPELFTPFEEMPEFFQAHMRYPEALFSIQSQQFLRYHVTDPDVFFVGEDFWEMPRERVGAGTQAREQLMEPYYVTLRLPEEGTEEFAIIMPFTPRNRQNTVAWLAGRADGEQYGELRAYRFPTDDLMFGPAQIEARIDQDPVISQQIALWNQSGAQVIRGNLLMIPIGNSFLFVEPIYLQAQDARLPELARVVVATGNRIAMERTLDEAIEVVFGQRAATPPSTETPTPGQPTDPGATPTPVPTATPTPAPATPTATPGPPPDPDDVRALIERARNELETLRATLDALEEQLNSGEQAAQP